MINYIEINISKEELKSFILQKLQDRDININVKADFDFEVTKNTKDEAVLKIKVGILNKSSQS